MNNKNPFKLKNSLKECSYLKRISGHPHVEHPDRVDCAI